MHVSEFTEWLLDKFRGWERKTGRRQTITAFARYLGVKQPTLSRWMAGDNPPEYDVIEKLAAKLGNDVYNVLGYIPPELKPRLDAIPPEEREAFFDWIDKYIEEKGYSFKRK